MGLKVEFDVTDGNGDANLDVFVVCARDLAADEVADGARGLAAGAGVTDAHPEAELRAEACLLGLLFLLCKERKTTGLVQITVQNGNRTHNTHVGVTSPQQVADVLARVNFARSLCV